MYLYIDMNCHITTATDNNKCSDNHHIKLASNATTPHGSDYGQSLPQFRKRQKWFKMRWSIKYILLAWWLKKLICWYKYMGRSQDLPIFGHIIWSVKGPVKFQNGLWFHYSFLISNNIFSVVQMKKWQQLGIKLGSSGFIGRCLNHYTCKNGYLIKN